MSRASIGFTSQDHSSDGMEAIKRTFTPEFRNRLDSVVEFDPLDAKTIALVADKLISNSKHSSKTRAWRSSSTTVPARG